MYARNALEQQRANACPAEICKINVTAWHAEVERPCKAKRKVSRTCVPQRTIEPLLQAAEFRGHGPRLLQRLHGFVQLLLIRGRVGLVRELVVNFPQLGVNLLKARRLGLVLDAAQRAAHALARLVDLGELVARGLLLPLWERERSSTRHSVTWEEFGQQSFKITPQ